ncbi:unnamed protein product [Tenebrio molitor]|nr:unnamed protein product [Tenebrio molitor]
MFVLIKYVFRMLSSCAIQKMTRTRESGNPSSYNDNLDDKTVLLLHSTRYL